mmetsp:Transcript_3434/g.5835  ORF Transcript_3434/g.5835 Transcript_3434/m.5835 type:complete len:85 (+) Transcript_3434:492-746(+)
METLLYCDPLLLRYMLILMKNDSSSYTFVGQPEQDASNSQEFIQSNKALIAQWKATLSKVRANEDDLLTKHRQSFSELGMLELV